MPSQQEVVKLATPKKGPKTGVVTKKADTKPKSDLERMNEKIHRAIGGGNRIA